MDPAVAQRGGGRGESPERLLLSRLISESLVEPVFQPVVDLHRGEITGFEALTRPASASGFDAADHLFDAAARYGLVWPVEAVTRRAAFQAAAAWPADTLLFMNCSPEVFADGRFAEDVLAAIERTAGLSPSRVVLEITERSEPEHVDGLASQVALLKRRGFQIAIDDVGAGTSGLNRIMKLRPHWLKLDRDLIESIDLDRVKQNLIRFLVHFARLSGVNIIAEGVERDGELATLMDLGVVHAQGYYLGRPGSREQILDPKLAEGLRARWCAARPPRAGEPACIAALVRPALTVPVGTTAAAAATLLDGAADQPGVAVLDGERLVGWCPRERLAGVRDVDVASLAQAVATIGPDTRVGEAIEAAGAKPGAAALPLAVLKNGRLLGVVTPQDLLVAAAEALRGAWRVEPLTGLPGRVPADKHLERQFVLAREGQATPDVAIIDIRHFGDFNGAYGYELGDELLQELGDLIRSAIVQGDPGLYIAHLGDDRFLVTGPLATLESRIPGLADRFEKTVATLCRGPLSLTAPEDGPQPRPVLPTGLGLRVVLLPDVFRHARDAREVYRLAQQARHLRPESGLAIAAPSCLVVRGSCNPGITRLSA